MIQYPGIGIGTTERRHKEKEYQPNSARGRGKVKISVKKPQLDLLILDGVLQLSLIETFLINWEP